MSVELCARRVTFLFANSQLPLGVGMLTTSAAMIKRTCNILATAVFILFANNVITITALKGGYEQLHTYNYAAKINIGVDGYVSAYHIDGLLKIQRNVETDRYTLLLSNLKHSYYYGEVNSARAGESNPIASDALQCPFYAEYKEDGQLKSITYPHAESEWSKRIKKSIASLFNFNQSYVDRGLTGEGLWDANDYSNVEDTVHGKCQVNYFIIRKILLDTSRIKLNLIRDYTLNTCDHFTDDINGFSTDYRLTKKTIESKNQWGHSSVHNSYDIGAMNGVPTIQKVSNQSSIHNFYDIDAVNGVPTIKSITNSESYTYKDSIGNVAFTKELLVNIRQSLVLNCTSQDDEFLNSFGKCEESDSVIPQTNITGKSLVDRIVQLVTESFDDMRKSNLSMVNQGEEHRQLFNKALVYLKQLGPDDFRILEEKAIIGISDPKLRDIFISILPYVGTKHSLDFTLDLISRKVISDDLAVKVLDKLPIYTPQTIPSLATFKSFVFDNNGQNKTELSARVYESAVVSFSHLLSSSCSRLDAVLKLGDEVAYHYLPYIWRAFEEANTTASKLVYLSAIGNIRSNVVLNNVTSILFRRSADTKDQDRLRLAAINILSRLIDVNSDIYPRFASNLTNILKNKTESIPIQIAAYDVLISKNNYAIDKFIEIGGIISDNEHLYNYHLSTVEGLDQIELLRRHAKFQINPSNKPVSHSLSKTVILKTDKILEVELLKSMLKIRSTPKTYLKVLLIDGEPLADPDWRIPSVVKLEIWERKGEEIVINKAVYLHTNFKGKDMDEGIFFDLWTIFNRNSRSYYVNTIEFQNTPNLLDLINLIFQKIQENVNFAYQELTTFSLKTGFGIDAVFEHKYPSLTSTLMDYNWNTVYNNFDAKVDFSFKTWSNGYSGVSMYNPFSGLIHSVRKTQQSEGAVSFSVIVKYDFSKNQFNLTVPLNFDDLEGRPAGLAVYSSTSVGITDANGEITCQNCGFRVASKDVPPDFPAELFKTDDHGLLICETAYNWDSRESFDSQKYRHNRIGELPHLINTSGYIITISHSNSEEPNSQVELLVGIDAEILKNREKPWYFLPGHKLNLDSSLGIRQIISNEVLHLLNLNFNMSSSQGHFLNLLQLKYVFAKRFDSRGDFILCFDGKVDFPEIDDNRLPTEVTQSTLKAFSSFKIGQSMGHSCSALDFAVDFNLTGKVSETHRVALENYASQSFCTLQKAKWRREGTTYPLTEACVREMIANTTLRNFKFDLTSEQFSDFSLLHALVIIRSTQDNLKEMVANWHNADVDIRMTSPLSEIQTRKQINFEADYPVPDIYKILPNVHFPQEFVLDFIDNKINVINVYPKTIVFNNKEMPFDALDDWKEINTGVEKAPYRIYASVMDYQVSLKILFKDYELILKPKLVESKNETYVPQIFYNQQLFSDFDQRLHLSSSQEILFSLSRVDDYIVIRSDQIPATIYYSTSSINIFQRT